MVKTPHLVSDYLEDLAGEILDESQVVEAFVGKRPGIYALYRKGTLYYVGLATDLKARLKQHQKDRHSGKWDRFSVFITTQDDHLKDLESLLLRVTKKPPGNRLNGKFDGAKKRNTELKRRFQSQQKEVMKGLFNIATKPTDSDKEQGNTRSGPWALRAFFKDNTYKALLRKDGSVRYKNKVYTSLSATATHVTGHPTNGRWFWWIKNHKGEWARVKET